MSYSKRQMEPLIKKYGINPEINKLFINVCEMFEDQKNYQVWAVKVIFSQVISFETLERIHNWILENATNISKLEKQNITAYSSKRAVQSLLKEMEGIDKISLVKNVISHFNTAQKRMLTESIIGEDMTPIKAYNDESFNAWYNIFYAFNKKPMGIKNRFYSTCSAIHNKTALKEAIKDCLKESYVWSEGKDDLFAFMKFNTPDCKVVFDEGNCVVVEVPSFNSSHKLCGNGRTQWCLSRDASYFNSYVTNYSSRRQYFLFDFSRRETDAFAHIGFTVDDENGIVEAQTGNNFPMNVEKYTQNDEKLNIHDILRNFKIPTRTFMPIPTDLGFKWDFNAIVEIAKNNPSSLAIAYSKNNKLILYFLHQTEFERFISRTYIKRIGFSCYDKNEKNYVLVDFNKKIGDDASLFAIHVTSDEYGSSTITQLQNFYGENIDRKTLTDIVGIEEDEFLNNEKIAPCVLLHKYIDNNEEKNAIELIENEGDNIDINYEFNNRIPVFSAINQGMVELFDKIVRRKDFNTSLSSGFGETLLISLLYLYGSGELECDARQEKNLKSMINSILSSEYSDFNETDINNETAINVACEYPKTLWVVEALASNPNVNVNVVDDFNRNAINTCIAFKNLDALKILGKRTDLEVRNEDFDAATKASINLSDYINTSNCEHEEYALSMAFA